MRSVDDILALDVRRSILSEHNIELFNLLIDKGSVAALKSFNDLFREYRGAYLWPSEWFDNETLIDVLKFYSGNAAFVFNHYTSMLDLLLIIREIDDVVGWLTKQDDDELAQEQKKQDLDVLHRFSRKKIAADGYNDYTIKLLCDVSDELINQPIQNHWRLSKRALAKRGMPTKRGWAVNELAVLIQDDFPNRPAVLAGLLSNLSNFPTSRQQVRSILQKGYT